MKIHRNAKTNVYQRRLLITRVRRRGWTQRRAAEAARVSVRTVLGDTLVVETSRFRDGGWLDIIGSPLTDAGKVTGRFRRVRYGRMEIDVTIEDAKAYTRPFTVRVNQQLMLDEELIEFIYLRESALREVASLCISGRMQWAHIISRSAFLAAMTAR